ncbi:type III secretion system stator protein SctL [Pseudomonas sp. FP1154]|jgi:type III secretion protein L|uniref:type III secretion system stator protein SctL n=1 Tax=Pseudomonas sp. FP1154 TaxID=2954077 RepID=UPI002734A2B2|nr:type III secretion system stator protein SctL [Pseudomonas sp. FP1154]WLG20907.1 type III secretion system stator protein SctL [Pseudomonas sp. FP1154]
MLIRRNLSLGDREVKRELVVRREQFADYRTAVDVMSRARAEADAILLEAGRRQQEYLDRALAEFWGQASFFLEALEAERQQCRNSVIEVCRELLNVIIGRLFDECPPEARARILLEHLAASQAYPAVSATLKCHPERYGEVQAWLAANNASVLWQLRDDITMPIQSIRLSTDTGEYDIDWTGLRRSFQVADA